MELPCDSRHTGLVGPPTGSEQPSHIFYLLFALPRASSEYRLDMSNEDHVPPNTIRCSQSKSDRSNLARLGGLVIAVA